MLSIVKMKGIKKIKKIKFNNGKIKKLKVELTKLALSRKGDGRIQHTPYLLL